MQEDLDLLGQLSPTYGEQTFEIPPPTLSPDERQQRRLSQLNELNLYKRKCDLTGKDIISNYHESSPYPVYEQETFYSDDWDPLATGRDIDWNKPFFQQFHELHMVAPRPNLFTGYQYDENCDYTNYAGMNKNCYLIFDSDENWDCSYSFSINSCKNSLDCYRSRKCELCCECIDCLTCYNCIGLQDCENCTDSAFLKNCIGCKNCLFCSNQRNKEYMINNQQVDQAQYEQVRSLFGQRSKYKEAEQQFRSFAEGFPQKFMHGVQNENVLGDYLLRCKNAYMCFDSEDLWDCRYLVRAFLPAKNCMDCEEVGQGELLYECACVGYNAHQCLFCANCLDQINNLLYCTYCFHCQHCFGCIGLRRKQYCIFNKQYDEAEYMQLVPKLIQHMQKTKEWGEFFPLQLSPFAYNETIAQEEYPLTEEQGQQLQVQWRQKDEKEYMPATAEIPDDIAAADDSLCEAVLACGTCGKNYKIPQHELKLRRQLRTPLPADCFHCRHERRRLLRNPRTLVDRTCGKCEEWIKTTYQVERPEQILCEKCYLEEVY